MEERLKKLEETVNDLHKRLVVEECRWKPKTDVYAVFVQHKTSWSLVGIYTTEDLARTQLGILDVPDDCGQITKVTLDEFTQQKKPI